MQEERAAKRSLVNDGKKIRLDVVIFLLVSAIILTALTTAIVINKRVSSLSEIQSTFSKLKTSTNSSRTTISGFWTAKSCPTTSPGLCPRHGRQYAQYFTKAEHKAYMSQITGEYEGVGVSVVWKEGEGCCHLRLQGLSCSGKRRAGGRPDCRSGGRGAPIRSPLTRW